MASNRITQAALRKSRAMGPSVRNLINQYNLDPNEISSSGPHQTLLKCDVLSYINQRKVNREYDVNASNQVFAPPKPAVAQSQASIRFTATDSAIKSRYPRRLLDPLEIEVINSGGLMETNSNVDKSGKQKKSI